MRPLLSGLTLITTVLFLLFLLSLLPFPMVVSASPNAQNYSPMMRKRTVHTYHRSLLQPGPNLVLRATSNDGSSSSSSTQQSSTAPTSTEAPSTTSRPSSTPNPTFSTIASPAPSPTASSPPSVTSTTPKFSTPTPTPTSTSTSISTISVALPQSIAATQSSSSILLTSSTSSGPFVATTLALPSPTTYPATFGQLPQTSSSSISAAQASTSVAPKGFFANTGAVAGTFTVVGLVAVALLATLFICIRNKRRTAYDDDDAFFEKIPAPASYSSRNGGGHRGLGTLSPVYPPVTDVYANDPYIHATNTHNGEYDHEPEQYGMEDVIYTTQQLQQQQQQQQQSAVNAAWAPRPTSPTSSSSHHHSYANPFNSPTPGGAVLPSSAHVNVRASSIAYGIPHDSQDSFYGGMD